MKEILTDLMNQLCFYPLALTASTLLAALAPASRPSLALWMLGALPVFFLYFSAALSGKQRLGSLLSYESDPGVFIVCCHFVFAVL